MAHLNSNVFKAKQVKIKNKTKKGEINAHQLKINLKYNIKIVLNSINSI